VKNPRSSCDGVGWAGGEGGQHPTDPGGCGDACLPHGIALAGTLKQGNKEQV